MNTKTELPLALPLRIHPKQHWIVDANDTSVVLPCMDKPQMQYLVTAANCVSGVGGSTDEGSSCRGICRRPV